MALYLHINGTTYELAVGQGGVDHASRQAVDAINGRSSAAIYVKTRGGSNVALIVHSDQICTAAVFQNDHPVDVDF